MKKVILVLAAILVILILIIALVLTFNHGNGGSAVTPTSSSTQAVTFPNSSNTSTNTPPKNLVLVTTQNNSKIATTDFIHNGTTIQDPANPGTYYLAGSSGACTHEGTCPKAGTTTDFTILYYPSNGSFNIGLATEPLGAVRIEAEDYLMQQLGLTENQMCELKYTIGTSVYVNQQYGGENLGFSFCPGAVALPQ